MKPISASEQMLYNTVRLVTDTGTGTGFFFNFIIGDLTVPVILTNKHVVNNKQKESVNFFFHTKKDDMPNEIINISFVADWYFHENQDLCFCFVNQIFEEIKTQTNMDIYYIPIPEDLILNNQKLEELSAIEDVIMVGYPEGLWDQKNNLPLFRKGITSAHPSIDFNGKNIGVVDMACFGGSSGSPIFVLNENGYADKNGNIFLGKRLIFLGVLFSGPRSNSRGELVVENIPTSTQNVVSYTPTMINLGYYIKAEEILIFKDVIQKIISL